MQDHASDVLNCLRVLVQSLRIASRGAERQVGLTGAQLFVLEKLRDAGESHTGLTVNEVAALTKTHQSTVSVVVTRLVKKKLVNRVRSKDDARVQLLTLTKLGRAKLTKAPVTIQDKLLAALAELPTAKQKSLASGLTELLEVAGLSDVEPALFLEDGQAKGRTKVAPASRNGTATKRKKVA